MRFSKLTDSLGIIEGVRGYLFKYAVSTNNKERNYEDIC
jgi:hypothetical protein